jgi:threonine dehydrogenase-like Zn-dependent dehydrogenase
VPHGVPDEVALFAEPLAAACRIPDQVHLQPSQRVVVLGDGKLGLLVAQVLALTGCHLLVIGRHPKNLSILSARGIPTLLDGGAPGDRALGQEADVPGRQADVPGRQADVPGRQADVVIDCTGSPRGFATALRLVRPQGTLVLKSTYPDRVPVDLSHLAVDEIRVVGSRCGPFPAALRLLARDLVDVTSMIEAEYPLQEGPAAIDHAGRRGALKVVVRP